MNKYAAAIATIERGAQMMTFNPDRQLDHAVRISLLHEFNEALNLALDLLAEKANEDVGTGNLPEAVSANWDELPF